MEDEDQIKIDVAVLKKEVTTLQEDIKELRETVSALTELLSEVKDLLNQYKGFAAAIILVGVVVGWLMSSMATIKDAVKGLFS